MESIDIGRATVPKPIKITLTPLAKQHNPKQGGQKEAEGSKEISDSAAESWRPSSAGREDGASPDGNPSRPSASEASTTSTASGPSSSLSFQIAQTSRSTIPAESASGQPARSQNVITASVQLLQGGCLPGDMISIKISIRHIKAVKSMHGVIVTLYRKARVDPHPIFAPNDPFIRNSRYDDIIPRSRTGFGGLSLTSSSNQQFRMDLAQTFAPIIINPTTLEAEIKTVIRAPSEDLFPTVTGIPGDLISFTYHVEVVMDLAGKLANQDRFFPRINMTSRTPTFSLGSKPSFAGYGTQSGSETYPLIDTTEIRRERSVPDCTFDLIIGSKDSSRCDSRRAETPGLGAEQESSTREVQAPDHSVLGGVTRTFEQDSPAIDTNLDRNETVRPPMIPPPDLEEPTDEKAHLRLLEQRVVPSAPSEDNEHPSSPQPLPSAPTLDEIEGVISSGQGMDTFWAGFNYDEDEVEAVGESAPAYQRHGEAIASASIAQPSLASEHPAGEDKQELERERLLALASSPEDRDEDQQSMDEILAGGGASSSASAEQPLPVPSAPVLDEEDDYVEGEEIPVSTGDFQSSIARPSGVSPPTSPRALSIHIIPVRQGAAYQ